LQLLQYLLQHFFIIASDIAMLFSYSTDFEIAIIFISIANNPERFHRNHPALATKRTLGLCEIFGQ